MKGCTIRNLITRSRGGAFANTFNNNITITDCNFRNITLNTTDPDPYINVGGVFNIKSNQDVNHTLTIEGCDFINCSVISGTHGGAIFFSGIYFIARGCNFQDCYARQGGGAICLNSAYMRSGSIIEKCLFLSNSAGTFGRDIYQVRNSFITWNKSNIIETCGSTNTINTNDNLFYFVDKDVTSTTFQQGCPNKITIWRTDAQIGQDVENCGGNYVPCKSITNILNRFGQSGFTLIPTGNATEQRIQVDDKDLKISQINFNQHYLIQSHYSSQPGVYPYDRAVIYVRNGKLTLEQMRLICQATYDSDGPMVAVNGQGS
ncbi:MAG: hypothetical protein EZS28_019317, partial [Streblomastix strix]